MLIGLKLLDASRTLISCKLIQLSIDMLWIIREDEMGYVPNLILS